MIRKETEDYFTKWGDSGERGKYHRYSVLVTMVTVTMITITMVTLWFF